MRRKGFIPRGDAEFLAWHDNFKTQILANAATLGLTAGDTAPITADNTDLHTKFAANTAAQAAASAAADAKNMSRLGADARARLVTKKAKASSGMTPAIADSLGIVGPEDSTDLNTSAPELTGVDKGGGIVELQFKKGPSEGIRIYSKRGDEPDFTFLASDTHPPYIDNRPMLAVGKAELREYRAKFIVDDEVVGNFSNEVVVSCKP
jgi:hypothetical protein